MTSAFTVKHQRLTLTDVWILTKWAQSHPHNRRDGEVVVDEIQSLKQSCVKFIMAHSV